MWYNKAVVYQIYPLGFCGAPEDNDGVVIPRISKVTQWIPHLRKLSVSAVYFCPVSSSDRHGYDTRDYFTLDCRLGKTKISRPRAAPFIETAAASYWTVCLTMWGGGSGHFRTSWSIGKPHPYRDWFHINFEGSNEYGDALWYEGWEGHNELVKLNLQNRAVTEHLFSAVRQWVELYGIDGLRLDVACCLNREFLSRLRSFCDALQPNFFLVGEILGEDYTSIMNGHMCHSATNYECYKGLYSSFNSMNLFEIAHSLGRQFGPEGWTLYKGQHLLCR